MGRVQQGFVKLEKLLQVDPYKIVGLWSNGETRLNDFSSEAEQWKNSANKALKKLFMPKVFKSAFVKDGTLAFAGSTIHVPGIQGNQPVDFDRRKLYSDSQLIGKVVTYEAAIKHQKKRLSRQKRPIELLEGFKIPSQSDVFKIDIETIKTRIGVPVTPLIVIGDELVELETTWTY